MKKTIALLILLLLPASIYAQARNEIPMYGGMDDRMTFKLLVETYRHAPRLFAALNEVSLGPPAVIVAGPNRGIINLQSFRKCRVGQMGNVEKDS